MAKTRRGDAVVGDVTNVDADDDLASAFNRDKPAGTVTGKPTATGSGATAKAGTIDAYFQPPRPDGTTAPPTVTAGRDTHADPKGSNPAASTAQPAPTTSRFGPRPEIKVYRQAPAAQHDLHKTKPLVVLVLLPTTIHTNNFGTPRHPRTYTLPPQPHTHTHTHTHTRCYP